MKTIQVLYRFIMIGVCSVSESPEISFSCVGGRVD